jgi:FkbM family methyltransferase
MSSRGRVAVARTRGESHHPVFYRFPRWQGRVPEGFIVNFLGVMTREHYWTDNLEIAHQYPAKRHVETNYPIYDEEYFEWIDLLEAVVEAKDHFAMLELGAGWGRWITNAAFALRHLGGPAYTLTAVEAEPTHLRWMVEHINDNGLHQRDFRLIQAAVASADGQVGFHTGDAFGGGPANCYGQFIGGPAVVDAVSLDTLLRPLTVVDLLDMDIQGAELEVLAAGAAELDKKVRKVRVATHSVRIDEGLRSLFARLGWKGLRCFPCGASAMTEWGEISFQDGVQTWINPTYGNPPGDDLVVLMQKLEACRDEGARLWTELEAVRVERERGSLRERSLAERIRSRLGILRDRIAPKGTGRRRILDHAIRVVDRRDR